MQHPERRAARHRDGRGPGLVREQRLLTKEVPPEEVVHLLLLDAILLRHDGLTAEHDVEQVARLALLHDVLARVEGFLLQRLRQPDALLARERGEDRHAVQERVALGRLRTRGLADVLAEVAALQDVHHALLHRHHRRAPRRAVHQGELAEDVARVLRVHAHLLPVVQLGDVEQAALNHVHLVVALVALPDQDLVLGDGAHCHLGGHLADDILLELREHEHAGQRLGDRVQLLLGRVRQGLVAGDDAASLGRKLSDTLLAPLQLVARLRGVINLVCTTAEAAEPHGAQSPHAQQHALARPARYRGTGLASPGRACVLPASGISLSGGMPQKKPGRMRLPQRVSAAHGSSGPHARPPGSLATHTRSCAP
mmetsp:Transcript_3054/g.10744  ORF Transcript_3054/g.10744 Transcript_3054/m.10744 type:complete len:368 (+) Transcript_3054:2861-3964(+)